MTAELVLGTFAMKGGGNAFYRVETIAEGMDFGDAEGRDVILETLLQDGAVITRDGYGNRVVTFGVLITARADGTLGLAIGERDLAAQIGRRNQLVWTPPDELGPPAVYTVVMSSLSFDFNDWGALKPGTVGRRYQVTLTCKPFVNSINKTIVEAIGSGELPPVEDTHLVDDCSATFPPGPSGGGWEVVDSVTQIWGTGFIRVQQDAQNTSDGIQHVGVRRVGVIDVSTSPYLMIDITPGVSSSIAGTPTLLVSGGLGSPRPAIGTGPSPDVPGAVRCWFDVSAVTAISSFTLFVPVYAAPYLTHRFNVNRVERTNLPPFVGTGRQQFRTLTIPGSARTEGSLQIWHDTSSLGLVAAYSNVADGSGYQPPCRRHRNPGFGGTVESDTSTASGSLSPLNAATPETYDIPATAVPEGTYAPMARLKADVAGYYNVTITASLLVGTNPLGTVTVTKSVNLATGWRLIPLGALPLPPVAVPPGTDTKVRVQLSAAGAVDVDDLYLFNLTVGALTLVDCGTGAPSAGGPANRLWIDTATLDRTYPTMWVGTEADGSDKHHVSGVDTVRSEQPHRWPPGEINLFTLTDNALFAAAQLEFYESWHSHPASLGGGS